MKFHSEITGSAHISLDFIMKFLAIFILLFLPASFSHASSFQVSGDLIRVIDGDTIVYNGKRIRLLGFDSPETFHARCYSEFMLGELAGRHLRSLISSSSSIRIVFPYKKRGKYGRLLGRLIIDGVDVSRIMTGDGYAVPYGGGRRISWCSGHDLRRRYGRNR